jgi:CDP-6-deoxy-D-xylo-4-hexulose-3-dehydrase
LPRLNNFIEIRNRNLKFFLEGIDERYISNYTLDGISSFCLPIFCVDKLLKEQVIKELKNNNIEYRPLIGGNLYKHPFLKNIDQIKYDINSEKAHQNCIYVGNNQDITLKDVSFLIDILNNI